MSKEYFATKYGIKDIEDVGMLDANTTDQIACHLSRYTRCLKNTAEMLGTEHDLWPVLTICTNAIHDLLGSFNDLAMEHDRGIGEKPPAAPALPDLQNAEGILKAVKDRHYNNPEVRKKVLDDGHRHVRQILVNAQKLDAEYEAEKKNTAVLTGVNGGEAA